MHPREGRCCENGENCILTSSITWTHHALFGEMRIKAVRTCITNGKKKDIYTIFIRQSEENRSVGRPSRKRDDIIKTNLKELDVRWLDFAGSARGQVADFCKRILISE